MNVVIDVDLVSALVAAQFPQFSDMQIEPVANSGWDNRTFHLGDAMLIRMPSAAHYADAVAKEQCWLPWLAPQLPLPIPQPLALGQPGAGYPWPWSIYSWLPGEIADKTSVTDFERFARQLAQFLRALQGLDTTGGPASKMRGGSLERWREQAETALELLQGQIDTQAATEIWQMAIDAPLDEPAVWFHGDIARGNLLVEQGELTGVIDFGGLAVGDPACDLAIAWTFLEPKSRRVFREALGVSDAIWNRGRGWVLWKAMIVMAKMIETNAIEAASAGYALDQLINDHLAC